MEFNNNVFDALDFGTAKPTSVPDAIIKVRLSMNPIIEDYAQGFLDECARVNPLTFDKVGLTSAELLDYISFLLDKRIESVENNCRDWRRLKVLVMPTFIQYVLSSIGKVLLYDEGLIIEPVKEQKSDITLDDAFRISSKIRAFMKDLQIVEDAMPRSPYGNSDVMRCVIEADSIHSMVMVEHPSSTYVAAFLNFTLGTVTETGKVKEGRDYSILYRRVYDTLSYIRTSMASERTVFH